MSIFAVNQAMDMTKFAKGMVKAVELKDDKQGQRNFEGLHLLELDFIDVNEL